MAEAVTASQQAAAAAPQTAELPPPIFERPKPTPIDRGMSPALKAALEMRAVGEPSRTITLDASAPARSPAKPQGAPRPTAAAKAKAAAEPTPKPVKVKAEPKVAKAPKVKAEPKAKAPKAKAPKAKAPKAKAAKAKAAPKTKAKPAPKAPKKKAAAVTGTTFVPAVVPTPDGNRNGSATGNGGGHTDELLKQSVDLLRTIGDRVDGLTSKIDRLGDRVSPPKKRRLLRRR